jgi:hypothetical protein
MATKGYIIVVDHKEIKNTAAELQKVTVNIRQTLRYVDTLGPAYAADAEETRQKLDECWGMVRQLFKEAMRFQEAGRS